MTGEHAAGCLCRPCHRARYVACLIAGSWGGAHHDHRVPECPSHPEPPIGAEATCRTCRRAIFYEVVEEHGYLPRTGWSDRFRRDALVCFRSADYCHMPTAALVGVAS